MKIPSKYRRVLYGKNKEVVLVAKNNVPFEIIHMDKIISPMSNIGDEVIFENDDNYTNVQKYIEAENLSIEEIILLLIKIGNLFEEINKNGYIIGSIDLEDILIDKNNENLLKLRQVRTLFNINNNNNIRVYIPGEIKTSQVTYNKFDEFNESSDVELLARVFIKLITNKNVDSYSELRHIAYNLRVFKSNIPIEIQKFINKLTSIYPHEKYKNIGEAIKDLTLLLKYMNLRYENHKKISEVITYSMISHVGKGKLQKEKDRKSIKEINQDSCNIYEVDNKIFAFVADGVSNCTYGSGDIASKLIKEVCDDMVQKEFSHIRDREDVYEFYRNIFEKANDKIISYINDKYEVLHNNDIMCSTFVGAIIQDNNLYVASIGDSKAYLINNILNSDITIDDNYGNELLKKQLLWNEYKSKKHKSSLTNVIGNIQGIKSFQFYHIKITQGDMILLCSDGLTDYIVDMLDMNDDWKKQEKIKEIINSGINKNYNISKINNNLVEKANNNGGFDNISSILIQV